LSGSQESFFLDEAVLIANIWITGIDSLRGVGQGGFYQIKTMYIAKHEGQHKKSQ